MDAPEQTQPQTQPQAQQLAEACAAKMWAEDATSQAMGMQIEHIGPGRATLSMRVREDMLNGQGHCHGGMMFTLADSAFAFACNAYNQFTVAQHCSVSFIRPALPGERLIATATECQRSGRSGIYDVMLHNQNNDLVAVFRGHSRTVKGQHLADADSPSS